MERKGKKRQKFEYLKNEKSSLDDIKTFFIDFEGLSFGEKNKNLIKIADTSFKKLLCCLHFKNNPQQRFINFRFHGFPC